MRWIHFTANAKAYFAFKYFLPNILHTPFVYAMRYATQAMVYRFLYTNGLKLVKVSTFHLHFQKVYTESYLDLRFKSGTAPRFIHF